jgi:hypothetical protein
MAKTSSAGISAAMPQFLYFFLRRDIGSASLPLLRFFLNHRPYLHSAKPERRGKTPAQLLTGQDHPHWLEMLGFQRFRRAVA